MRGIENYRKSIKNPILDKQVKGFVNGSYIDSLRSNTYVAKIPVGMGYRPDLVAEYFLHDSNSAWIITCINNFTNGIKDYKEGRKILIPNGD